MIDITTQNWFSYSINESKKSYMIINIDWNTGRLFSIERYIGTFNDSESETMLTGKIFIDIGNGSFDNDFNIKHNTIMPAPRTFDEDKNDVINLPKWSEYKDIIIKTLNDLGFIK